MSTAVEMQLGTDCGCPAEDACGYEDEDQSQPLDTMCPTGAVQGMAHNDHTGCSIKDLKRDVTNTEFD